MKYPLLYPALAWTAGLIAGHYLEMPVFFPMIATGMVLCLSFTVGNRIFSILAALFLLALSVSTLNRQKPSNHISSILEGHDRIIQKVSGIISSEVRMREGGCEFNLDLESVGGLRTSGRVKVFSSSTGLEYGDMISTVCRISAPELPSNPSGFDYAGYLDSRGIHAFAYTVDCVEKTGSRVNILKSIIIKLRRAIRTRIEERFPDKAGFIKAVLIGERKDLGDMRTIMNKAGLSHLLAVSGLHVGLISLVMYSVLVMILRSRLLVRPVMILILLIYAGICSWSPSVFRAVVMISLYLLARMVQRKPQAINILAASLIIITAVDPQQVFSIGFQMSFLAVYILMSLVPRIKLPQLAFLPGPLAGYLRPVLSLELVTVCLTLFLAPLTMLHFNQLNFNGLIGNLAGIPLISLILPLALLILILPGFSPLLNIYRSAFRGLFYLFEQNSRFCAGLFLRIDFIPFSKLRFWLTYLLLFGSVSLLLSSAGRKLKLAGMILILVMSSILFIPSRDQELVITMFDCGLGDLCLLETTSDEVIMIDCGPREEDRGHFRFSALGYFKQEGLKVVDHLFITHAHNDHYGGFETILEELTVKRVYLTDEFKTRKVFPVIEKWMDSESAELIIVTDTTHLSFGDLNLKVLHPDKHYSHTNINNLSIVVRLDYKDFSALFCGDLEEEGEHYLLEHYPEYLDCDLLKVGHHGSNTSSTPDFISRVSPGVAFISTSLKNRFDFPHRETLEKYRFLGERLIVSGKDGALIVRTEGNDVFYNTVLSRKEFMK